MCIRLESQLAAIDRGTLDPARAVEVKRYEDAANKLQGDLDRLTAQARRTGCEGRGFFALFSGQPAQCGPLNNQIQQTRANLDRALADLQRAQGNSADREAQRRPVLVALAQNDCGPQYRAAAVQPRDFFETLFGTGPGPGSIYSPAAPSADTFRTLCVRVCDGYYFPISYSTVPSKFAEDEKLCQRMCPAAEVALYSHRNPGEDVAQATSASGQQYSELPSAFNYRKQFNPTCSCRLAGQSWADALKQQGDPTVEPGDIVVTEEQARRLSQPQPDAKGQPAKQPQRPGTPAATPARPAPAPAPIIAEEKSDTGEAGKRPVRSVGPTFLPAR